jgi:cell division protein FtsN
VQALATRDAMAARRLRDRLAGRGFPATVTEDRSGGQSVYRVRVGRYRTRDEAEAAVRVLRQRQHLSPWILQGGE